MKNDLWYAGEGFWVVYCEDPGIITEFKIIKALQESAVYFHYRAKGKHASQFKFQQDEPLEHGQCLLSYVCARLHFDFSAALGLYRTNDSTPYLDKYPVGYYQLELFPEYYLDKLIKTRSKTIND